MKTMSEKDLALFNTAEGRKKLMQKYGDSQTAFTGHNTDGELVMVSISYESIVIQTYQSNYWLREDWYNKDGIYEAEMYKGRWN